MYIVTEYQVDRKLSQSISEGNGSRKDFRRLYMLLTSINFCPKIDTFYIRVGTLTSLFQKVDRIILVYNKRFWFVFRKNCRFFIRKNCPMGRKKLNCNKKIGTYHMHCFAVLKRFRGGERIICWQKIFLTALSSGICCSPNNHLSTLKRVIRG